MQYTKIVTVCDIEWQSEDEEVEAEEFVYYILETGPTALHLCPNHHEHFETKLNLVEMREWCAQYGRPYIEEPKGRRSRKTNPKVVTTKEGKVEYHCRWCSDTSPSPQGIGAHEAKRHPAEFEAAGGAKKKQRTSREPRFQAVS